MRDALLLLATPAKAAFPGGNGKTAFDTFCNRLGDIFDMDPDGGHESNLTKNGLDNADPAYSANGRKTVRTRFSSAFQLPQLALPISSHRRRLAMARPVAIAVFLITLATAAVGAIAVSGRSGASGAAGTAATPERPGEAVRRKPLRYEEHDLFIETNATDGDAGLQMFLDAEDWRRTKLRDTRGRVLADVEAKGRLHSFGLTELFFEAAEPSFDEFPFSRFKKRFPEGKYKFRGRTVNGSRLVSSDRLSHLVPDGPNVTFPTRGARVDPNGFEVTWESVTSPSGVKIVSYQVIVNQDGRELSMYLPPSATSATIPGEFLEPATEAGGEVLAREKSGNQTITAIPRFKTK